MTMPDEEIQALKNINNHLLELIHIRKKEDRWIFITKLLRHYPANILIDRYWKNCGLPEHYVPK